jgi:hypothetical protein
MPRKIVITDDDGDLIEVAYAVASEGAPFPDWAHNTREML